MVAAIGGFARSVNQPSGVTGKAPHLTVRIATVDSVGLPALSGHLAMS